MKPICGVRSQPGIMHIDNNRKCATVYMHANFECIMGVRAYLCIVILVVHSSSFAMAKHIFGHKIFVASSRLQSCTILSIQIKS